MSLLDRLNRPGPKRILSLDGGGIRGVLSLGFLERIEAMLRERHNNPDLRLCDYFDLIGGTSTGAIIAGALALGMDVAELKAKYLQIGDRIFGKKKINQLKARFHAGPLSEELAAMFGDITLGEPTLKTGLCIVTKRADTNSTWPLINHPGGKFYEYNRDIRLRDAIRASTAAPVYFMPQTISVGGDKTATFVDGGVSMAVNPAFQLFQVATLQGFPFHWQTGENKMLIVSVGTGVWQHRADPEKVAKNGMLKWAGQVPGMIMDDSKWQTQLILQMLSNTPTPWTIDSEIGNLAGDLLTKEPILSYLRYDVRLENGPLTDLGLPDLGTRAEALRNMSSAKNRHDLSRIGERAAAAQIRKEHLPKAFDLDASLGETGVAEHK